MTGTRQHLNKNKKEKVKIKQTLFNFPGNEKSKSEEEAEEAEERREGGNFRLLVLLPALGSERFPYTPLSLKATVRCREAKLNLRSSRSPPNLKTSKPPMEPQHISTS